MAGNGAQQPCPAVCAISLFRAFHGTVTVALVETVNETTSVMYNEGSGIVKDTSLKVSLKVPSGVLAQSSITAITFGKW